MAPPAIEILRGARATEAALLAEVAEHAAGLRGAPAERLAALLARPARIVVPSRALREHVAGRLVVALGGAAAGILVQTLTGLARGALERGGAEVRGAEALFRLLVRREARREPTLHAELDAMRDGYAAAIVTVGDLLDAGFTPENREGLLEAIDSSSTPEALRARAAALVRVAARTFRALDGYGLSHRSGLLARAADLLGDRPDLLPARRIWIHGFADVTGTAGALLETLVRAHGARALLDHPPDPALPGASESRFADDLAQRLGHWASQAVAPGEGSGAESITLTEAPGAEAETRHVAEQVRALLDAGVPAERIAIVARAPSAYVAPLRRHLGRLAIPFSGASHVAAVERPGARTFRALLELLRAGEDAPVDVWRGASTGGRSPAPGSGTRSLWNDVRVALHALGAARVGDAARLDVAARLAGKESFALPVRTGARIEDEQGETNGDDAAPERRERGTYVARRHVSARVLEETVADARALAEALAAWPARAPFAERRAALEELLGGPLRWLRRGAPFAALASALDELAAEVPEDLAIDGAEMEGLLEHALRGAAAEPIGGAGGGVAVLSVTQARGLTFERLFVLGMNRDVFPRRVNEDPLLPDALRDALEPVLPFVPRKRRGYDEERYLFAQLCSASPHVALSWQSTSEEGRARAPSPLVERLRIAGFDVQSCAPVHGASRRGTLRPAFEHAIAEALHGDARTREAAYAAALDEARARLDAPALAAPGAVAAARRGAREEWDAAPGSRPLGAFFGFVGAERARELRGQDVFVTQLETLARCPWRYFLEKLLRLEPVPDALGWLPGRDARLLGGAAHKALEDLVRAGAGLGAAEEAVEDALARAPRTLRWPEGEDEARIVLAAVEGVLREEGLALPGLAAALARELAPVVARARALLGAAAQVYAAEAYGSAPLAGLGAGAEPLVLRFKTDLVARGAGGAPELVDYKTGAPLSRKEKPPARREELVEKMASGLALQAALYARCAPGARGRYLYLGDATSDDHRSVSVDAGDPELAAAFDAAVAALANARRRGLFVPRLLTRDGSKGAASCKWCDVSLACVRGDSGARGRLRAWAESEPELSAAEEATPDDAALRALWKLGPKT